MTPVRTQDDECESVAFVSAAKRLLHIGKRIIGWFEQATVRVGLSGTDTTSNEGQAYCERNFKKQTRMQTWHRSSFPWGGDW